MKLRTILIGSFVILLASIFGMPLLIMSAWNRGIVAALSVARPIGYLEAAFFEGAIGALILGGKLIGALPAMIKAAFLGTPLGASDPTMDTLMAVLQASQSPACRVFPVPSTQVSGHATESHDPQ